MTEPRQKLIECRAVRQQAEHYHKSPALISEAELRQYFLYLKNVKHYSRPTMTVAICGIKFFFERTLVREWTTFNLVAPPPKRNCPSSSAAKKRTRFWQASGYRAIASA